jgi:hypothetical protein
MHSELGQVSAFEEGVDEGEAWEIWSKNGEDESSRFFFDTF